MKYIYILLILFFSCNYPEMIRNEIVFKSDFENNSLEKIDGGVLMVFNNSNVLGNFNNDGFNLVLDDIGDHDYLSISFDLYIHGTWDGNSNGFTDNDKADIWSIEINPDMDLFKDSTLDKYTTTFSNSPCFSNYCKRQSYPEIFPFDNPPKKGAHQRNLTKVCDLNFFGEKTTLYKVEKVFKSSGNSVMVRFYDELYQPNAIDNNGISQEKCDESWSLDNLTVRAISYK